MHTLRNTCTGTHTFNGIDCIFAVFSFLLQLYAYMCVWVCGHTRIHECTLCVPSHLFSRALTGLICLRLYLNPSLDVCLDVVFNPQFFFFFFF